MAKRLRPNDRGGKPPPDGWQEKFLKGLADTQLVGEALKVARVSRSHVYRQRKLDPEFDEKWTEVIERSTEVLEQIAVRRAAEGSDTLMIFLLKARRPAVYRENIKVDHQVAGVIGLALPGGKEPIQFSSDKRREAAALLLAADAEDEVVESTAVEEDAAA